MSARNGGGARFCLPCGSSSTAWFARLNGIRPQSRSPILQRRYRTTPVRPRESVGAGVRAGSRIKITPRRAINAIAHERGPVRRDRSGLSIEQCVAGARRRQRIVKMQVGESIRTFRIGDDPQLAQKSVRIDQRDGRCIVRFKSAGKPHGLFVVSMGSRLDVLSVLKGVDEFMSELGRQGRVFQFAVPRAENGEWRIVPVADPARVEPAAARLGLPVNRRS